MASRKVSGRSSLTKKRAPKSATAKRATKSTRGKKAAVEYDDGEESTGSPAREGGTLVIVESPAKAKTIGKYLGRGYRVRATVGHIMDLPEKKLGIDVEKGFHPDLVPIPGKEKTIAELKSAAKNAKAAYIATDPDREAKAIAHHGAQKIRPKGGKKKSDGGEPVST